MEYIDINIKFPNILINRFAIFVLFVILSNFGLVGSENNLFEVHLLLI